MERVRSVVRLVQSRQRGVCLSRATQELPRTFGALRASSFSEAKLANRTVKDELRSNLICKIQRGEDTVSGHRRVRRHGRAAGGQRGSFAPQLHSARTARAGQDAPDPHADHAAGRMDAVRRGLRDPRQSVPADLPALPRPDRRDRATTTPIAWLHREHRYVEKLATPDVTIADMIGDIDPIKAARARAGHLRRADRALRAAAARQSRHLRDQRTAGSGGQDPGRPVQHHAGRRCAD